MKKVCMAIILLFIFSVSAYANSIYSDMPYKEWVYGYKPEETDAVNKMRICEMPTNRLDFIYNYEIYAAFRVKDQNDFFEILDYHIYSRYCKMTIVVDDESKLTEVQVQTYLQDYIDENHRDKDGWYLHNVSFGYMEYYLSNIPTERAIFKPCEFGFPRKEYIIWLQYKNDDTSKVFTENISDVHVNGTLKTPDDISKLGEIMYNNSLDRMVIKYEGPEITSLPETESFLALYAQSIDSGTQSHYYLYYLLKGYSKEELSMLREFKIFCRQIGDDRYLVVGPPDFMGDNFISDSRPQGLINEIEGFLSDCTFTEGMSEYEKFMVIAKAVEYKITYGPDFYPTQVNFLFRTGVCDGFADVMQALCLYKGISCLKVTGFTFGKSHAWNAVQIDGYWYEVEPQTSSIFTYGSIYEISNPIKYPEFTYCTVDEMKSRPRGVIIPEYSSEFELSESVDTGIISYKNKGTTVDFDVKNKEIKRFHSYDTVVTLPTIINGITVNDFSDDVDVFLPRAEELIIPQGIKSLKEGIFSNKQNLKKVVLDCKISTIPDKAFYNCTKLIEINIPDTVTHIGESAFNACVNLNQLSLDNITSISANAFSNCYRLENINFSDKLNIIGDNSFYNCENLDSVVIPESVNVLGENAFANCTTLLDIQFLSDAFIPQNAFNNTPYFNKYANKDNYYLLGNSTVYILNNRTSISLEDGVRYISVLDGAIPDKISNVNLYIPETVKWIDDEVFKFNFIFNVHSGNKHFVSYSNVLLSYDMSKIYAIHSSKTNLFVTLSVKEFGENAFYNSTQLESITFGGDAPICSDKIFSNCKNLNSITCIAGKVGFLNAPYSNYTKTIDSNNEPHTLVTLNGDLLTINANGYKTIPIVFVRGILDGEMYLKVINTGAGTIKLPDGISNVKIITLESLGSLKSLTRAEYISYIINGQGDCLR